ncbi:MAG: N-acetylglucosamine-6-phosphate deacetylase [Atopobiaceae bacterium]|nr:N-acetylglucosamine-6-phosphate deacetylase [Atopobiaceae bacterium]
MGAVRITRARVFEADGTFTERDLCLQDGHIVAEAAGDTVDARGLMAIPGLVDVHFHGCMGQDMCNGTEEAIRTLASYEASQGVLAICPATMTYPEEKLNAIADAAAAWVATGPHKDCADLVGINMEGPFISPNRVGAQNPAYVQRPDVAMFRRVQARSGGLFKLVTLAPEVDGALEFVDELAGEVGVSVGHTCATYKQAATAFEHGARQVTHMWNAQPPLHHRDPAVVGAASDYDHVRVEIICDGIHLHPATVRIAFKLFAGRVIMIADSMEATGLADGEYALGGQKVIVRGNLATLESGTIAGSATNLFDCLRWAVHKAKIPLADALLACTLTPAQAIGVDSSYGSLDTGCVANVVLVDDNLDIHAIYLRGERLD